MDPLLFGVHADVVAEAIGTIVVLSLVIERSLALLFESRWFIRNASRKGVKESSRTRCRCWWWPSTASTHLR